jgi:hypothetical protein
VNRKLRHSWILLLLGGLLVLLGGSAVNSSAAECNTVTHFRVALPSSPFFVDLQTNSSFTATVTALSACDENPVSSYKGPATLRASGTLVDGTVVDSMAGGIVDISPLKFKQGIATPTVKVEADALGVALKATDDAIPSISGSSTLFDVFDETNACGDDDGCSESLGAVAGTTISADLPDDVSGFLGLSLSPHILDAGESGCPAEPGADAMGAQYTIAPPAGLLAEATYTATVRYTKKVAPGTGVSNFVHCMATPRVEDGVVQLDFTRVLPCDNKNPEPKKCILEQRRTGVGDLVVTFLLSPGDPVGGGFS